jgi:hypothetical protein
MSNAKVHFIGGEKGGVGKSLLARILCQYFHDRGIPFRGFDTDKSHGALIRFYGNDTSSISLDQFETLDSVVESALHSQQRAVVDLAAQTHPYLMRWLEESSAIDLANEIGVTLTYWHVMDSGRDSVELLRTLLDQFGGHLKIVVVLNELRGGEFDILRKSGQLVRAESMGASVINIRKVSDATMQKIDQLNTSFWAASQRVDNWNTGLALFERQRVKVWLDKTYGQLDSLNT